MSAREPAWLRALDRWKVVPEVLTAKEPLPKHNLVETVMPRCRCRVLHHRDAPPETCPSHESIGSQR